MGYCGAKAIKFWTCRCETHQFRSEMKRDISTQKERDSLGTKPRRLKGTCQHQNSFTLAHRTLFPKQHVTPTPSTHPTKARINRLPVVGRSRHSIRKSSSKGCNHELARFMLYALEPNLHSCSKLASPTCSAAQSLHVGRPEPQGRERWGPLCSTLPKYVSNRPIYFNDNRHPMLATHHNYVADITSHSQLLTLYIFSNMESNFRHTKIMYNQGKPT